MIDNESPQMNDEDVSGSSQAWNDVGKQIQSLGESLAQAFRTTWNDETNRRKAQEMRSGLESLVNEVSQAIKESAATPTSQQIRSEAEKTYKSIRSASEQTYHDMQPHILSALQQVNAELQKMINRVDQAKQSEEEASRGDEPPVDG